jgi:hypothetical protein
VRRCGDSRQQPFGAVENVLRASAHLQHLRQARADQIAPPVQFVRVTLGAIAVELLAPFHHVAATAVLLDQLGDAVSPLRSQRVHSTRSRDQR